MDEWNDWTKMIIDNLLEEAVATMSHDYEATILSQMPFSLKPLSLILSALSAENGIIFIS